jgi:hypothetical protein
MFYLSRYTMDKMIPIGSNALVKEKDYKAFLRLHTGQPDDVAEKNVATIKKKHPISAVFRRRGENTIGIVWTEKDLKAPSWPARKRKIVISDEPEIDLTPEFTKKQKVKKFLADVLAKRKEARTKAKGKQVLEMPDVQKKIERFAQVYGLTAERDQIADAARKVQDARVAAMKNKELEKLTKKLIDLEALPCLFDDMCCYKLNYGQRDGVDGYNFYGEISLVPGSDINFEDSDTMGAVVFSSHENDYLDEDGNAIDIDEALSVFENFRLGFYNTIQSTETLLKNDATDQTLHFYLEDQKDVWKAEGNKGRYKKPETVWANVGGYYADRHLKDYDRKFYLVYLKKKFNLTEDDIQKMIAKKKAELQPFYAAEEARLAMVKSEQERRKEEFKRVIEFLSKPLEERQKIIKERAEAKKEKRKEKSAARKEKTSAAGIPQGKANAKVFETKDEVRQALTATGLFKEDTINKFINKIPEGKKVKMYLARSVIHSEYI